MAKGSSSEKGATARVALIGAVKSYLGFLVLVLLVAEATGSGALVLIKDTKIQALVAWVMFLTFAVLSTLVTVLALKKPDMLMRSVGSRSEAEAERQGFLDQLYGEWAERVDGADPTALSIVVIEPDPVAHSIVLTGNGFDHEGGEASFWYSKAVGVSVAERKVLYYFTGSHSADTPGPVRESVAGFGEITFFSMGSVLEARGWFSDAKWTDANTKFATKGSFLQRLTADEAKRWRNARDSAARAQWTAEKLRKMSLATPPPAQPAIA